MKQWDGIQWLFFIYHEAEAKFSWFTRGLLSLLSISWTAAFSLRVLCSTQCPRLWPLGRLREWKEKVYEGLFFFPADHPKSIARKLDWGMISYSPHPTPCPAKRLRKHQISPPLTTSVNSPTSCSAWSWQDRRKSSVSQGSRHTHFYLLAELFFKESGKEPTDKSSHDLIIWYANSVEGESGSLSTAMQWKSFVSFIGPKKGGYKMSWDETLGWKEHFIQMQS